MKFAIYGQYYQNNTFPIVEKVITYLQNELSEVFIYEKFLDRFNENNHNLKLPIFTRENFFDQKFDFVISIGGDGSILRCATLVQDSNIPIIGINAGRLGFLATIQEKYIESMLEKFFNKNYSLSKRALVAVNSSPNNKDLDEVNYALNEVSVSRKDTTSMITIETYIDNEYLNSYWADGLIIATPTGSTGYSLSCGGPVIMPSSNCFVITPVAPHTLTARPLVIPDNVTVKLKVSGREPNYLVALDSRMTSVDNHTVLEIQKAPFTISLVEFPEEGFLKTIRKKLLWGEDKRN